jgi:hypothetical protein
MSQFTCEQLTEAVKRVNSLKEAVDLALFKFDPEGGMPAMEEAKVILEKYNFVFPGSKEFYDYFTNNIGPEIILEKRTKNMLLGGKTLSELQAELTALSVDRYDFVDQFLQLKRIGYEFNYSKETKRTNLILLQPSDFGFEGWTRIGDLYQKALSLGLYFCPMEVGVRYAIQTLSQERNGPSCSVALDQIDSFFYTYDFSHSESDGSPNCFLSKFDPQIEISDDRVFLFSLDDPRKGQR